MFGKKNNEKETLLGMAMKIASKSSDNPSEEIVTEEVEQCDGENPDSTPVNDGECEIPLNAEDQNDCEEQEDQITPENIESAESDEIPVHEDDENPSTSLEVDDLRREKGKQNLQERIKLLNILRFLFGAQLFFMNIVVLCIVAWAVFEIPFLRDEVNIDILMVLIDLTKYYITAVLVELLGGVIYIVHKVFSDKTIDLL